MHGSKHSTAMRSHILVFDHSLTGTVHSGKKLATRAASQSPAARRKVSSGAFPVYNRNLGLGDGEAEPVDMVPLGRADCAECTGAAAVVSAAKGVPNVEKS